jgi:hypothetical protein
MPCPRFLQEMCSLTDPPCSTLVVRFGMSRKCSKNLRPTLEPREYRNQWWIMFIYLA